MRVGEAGLAARGGHGSVKNCMESTDVLPAVASPTDLMWQSAAAWKGLTGTSVDSKGTWR